MSAQAWSKLHLIGESVIFGVAEVHVVSCAYGWNRSSRTWTVRRLNRWNARGKDAVVDEVVGAIEWTDSNENTELGSIHSPAQIDTGGRGSEPWKRSDRTMSSAQVWQTWNRVLPGEYVAYLGCISITEV